MKNSAQDHTLLRNFRSFEQPRSLIIKIPHSGMAVTIHMMNRIREEEQKKGFSGFRKK